MNGPEYKSYLDELSPFESEEQKKKIIFAHLRGLKGQLETLMAWKDDEPKYKKFYERTFGNTALKPKFETLYNKLSDTLSNEGIIDQTKYDEIYKQWEQLSKYIGN